MHGTDVVPVDFTRGVVFPFFSLHEQKGGFNRGNIKTTLKDIVHSLEIIMIIIKIIFIFRKNRQGQFCRSWP